VFKTHATYAMEVCLYGGYNCAFDWKLVGTLDGACLELNPNDFPSYNSYERFIVIFSEIVIIFLGSLSIQVGMNVSDHFGGWHGNANKGISALHTCCNEWYYKFISYKYINYLYGFETSFILFAWKNHVFLRRVWNLLFFISLTKNIKKYIFSTFWEY